MIELGSGAALGCCISALISGANKAIGLDVVSYADNSDLNFRILEGLLPSGEQSNLKQVLSENLRELSAGRQPERLNYIAPWTDETALPPNTGDYLFSQSVMEHVTNVEQTYRACFRWLKPGALMTHKIDHSSHGMTKDWHGHYSIPGWLWSLMVGKRPYLLNRMPPKEHTQLAIDAGFDVLEHRAFFSREDTAPLESVSDPDKSVRASMLVCRKPLLVQA